MFKYYYTTHCVYLYSRIRDETKVNNLLRIKHIKVCVVFTNLVTVAQHMMICLFFNRLMMDHKERRQESVGRCRKETYTYID